MKNKIVALVLLCIAVVVIAGCTSLPGGISKSTTSLESYPAGGGGGGGGSVMQSAQDMRTDNYGPSPIAVPTPAPTAGGLPGQGIETKIIRTAQVNLEVKNVTDAVESIKNTGTRYGGYVSTTNIGKNYNDQTTGTVIIRVPAEQFDNALSGVKGIGTIKTISTQGQDVTEEYVDVQAQITSYENQIAQYNLIMKNATNVKDLINIQQQIDSVQTSLNRVSGRMNYLNSQIDYSTISVSLQEPEPVGGQRGHDFVTAINEGINGFFGVIDVLIVFFLSIIPLIVIGCIAYGGYLAWKRKKR
jgi:hypothetical protein